MPFFSRNGLVGFAVVLRYAIVILWQVFGDKRWGRHVRKWKRGQNRNLYFPHLLNLVFQCIHIRFIDVFGAIDAVGNLVDVVRNAAEFGVIFSHEWVINMIYFSFDYQGTKKRWETVSSGGFILPVKDEFFIITEIKLNYIFAFSVLHWRLLSVSFFARYTQWIHAVSCTTNSLIIVSKGVRGYAPASTENRPILRRQKNDFLACVMTQAVLASLLHSP